LPLGRCDPPVKVKFGIEEYTAGSVSSQIWPSSARGDYGILPNFNFSYLQYLALQGCYCSPITVKFGMESIPDVHYHVPYFTPVGEGVDIGAPKSKV